MQSSNNRFLIGRTVVVFSGLMIASGLSLACDKVPSLTAKMIDQVVAKNKSQGGGDSVQNDELKSLLQGRSTLNVSSAYKYDNLLGITQASQFADAMKEMDVNCSSPNGHFHRDILFNAMDVTNNGRITKSDSAALGGDNTPPPPSPPPSSGSDIKHIGTNEKYGKGDISIKSHSNTRSGDLLLLFVHRTDGPVLKGSFGGWKFLTKCEKHPTNFRKNDTHCDHNGKNTDLGQSIFYRRADFNGEKSFSIDMSGSKPTWAIITTLRNAATSSPMRSVAKKGCDGDKRSVFPSVNGQKGDLLVMSQSFDDKVSQSRFQAPSGATLRGYISGSDEAGFLYTKPVTRSGSTGKQATRGSGSASCKDGLISLTIKKK